MSGRDFVVTVMNRNLRTFRQISFINKELCSRANNAQLSNRKQIFSRMVALCASA